MRAARRCEVPEDCNFRLQQISDANEGCWQHVCSTSENGVRKHAFVQSSRFEYLQHDLNMHETSEIGQIAKHVSRSPKAVARLAVGDRAMAVCEGIVLRELG